MNSLLDFSHLVWALGMMAIAIGLSRWQKIGLEGQLAIATGRTVLQHNHLVNIRGTLPPVFQ